ncbi:unnamed protein product [Coffea canephora]|uniref:DH200=94 genomic scaffold, scaffold_9078 n=1 Tax=Coffea canephora TaxID=49390 RepID=A0A068VN29_COFCA|nr:unnamed protein product [Coffea canephora]
MNMRAPTIYVNIFSWEAATQFPIATQTARGGANAMGLGKTVMTIALILARQGREYIKKKKKESDLKPFRKVKGSTLIICPMALLGQRKDELETHSKPDSISVSVFFGGDRSSDPRVIAEPNVILTTYSVLTAASYKNEKLAISIFLIDWYRVVLDEAHTIKSSKTLGAQAAFKLSSYCMWCLTGTPLQNKLEDLYNLLCFLHVEPWCN